MSKKNLVYIVAVMVSALLGLVFLQFYWINLTIQINREQFGQNVKDVLRSVAMRIDQYEALSVARRDVVGDRKVDDYFALDFDSTGTARWEETQEFTITQTISSERLAQEGMAYEVEERAEITTYGVATRVKAAGTPVEGAGLRLEIEDAYVGTDSVTSYRRGINPSLAIKIRQKINVAMAIVQGMLNNEQENRIEDRIPASMLDSLIALEIKAHGITLDYGYGLLDQRRPNENFIFTNAPHRRESLVKSEFYTVLFQNDIYGSENILFIDFPEERSYIFGKVIAVLMASSVFMFLIIGASAFAVYTIIKQKKISEITKDFISNMTHELKTPISTVSLACEALMDPEIRQLPSSARYLTMIKEENGRLAMQVEKVLQIARLDKGDFKLKITSVNLHQVIEKTVRNILIQIEERNGRIDTFLEAENPMVEGDEVHITNIVNNLLDNANKYSPESPEITIRTLNDNKGVKLFVSDKGQGISNEMLNKIFDKFYRVPTGNVHNVKGFGLGLSYVKTMMEAHQGTIHVKSELNKGSTFIINLPYKHG